MPDLKTRWGLIAEYDEPEQLLQAAEKARDHGFTRLDAYTPFPIHGLYDALGHGKTRLQWLVLIAGIIGGVGGFWMQYYANVIDLPWNVGGRPLNSWPSFMPVAFELSILFAALTAVIGMLVLNGLPKPYHPLFNVKEFEAASKDKFFLCVKASDPKFNLQKTKAFLQSLDPRSVYEVEP